MQLRLNLHKACWSDFASATVKVCQATDMQQAHASSSTYPGTCVAEQHHVTEAVHTRLMVRRTGRSSCHRPSATETEREGRPWGRSSSLNHQPQQATRSCVRVKRAHERLFYTELFKACNTDRGLTHGMCVTHMHHRISVEQCRP